MPILDCGIFSFDHRKRIGDIIKKPRIIDLLTFLPKKCTEVILVNNFLDILNYHNRPNTLLTLMVHIEKVYTIPNTRQFIAEGRCYNAYCKILFFRVDRVLYTIYKPNSMVIISGKAEVMHDRITMIHPCYKGRDLGAIVPYEIQINYCSNRLKNSFLKRRIHELLGYLSLFAFPDEWIPKEKREEYNLPSFLKAICAIHGYGPININLINQSRNRIVLEEIIAYHLLIRSYSNQLSPLPKEKTQEIVEIIIQNKIQELNLPFSLREDQYKACKEILEDIVGKNSLYRLLQGDVGSGKTVICVLISSYMISIGKQVAILAPSITLASQHYKYFSNLLPEKNIVLLTSITTSKSTVRQMLIDNISSGAAQIVIGTHSILSEQLQFKDLGLIIFDEHHKFGVLQRSQLASRYNCHILSTTATPSPRTMMFVYYGFLDVSTLEANTGGGRQTFAISAEKVEKVIDKIQQWITNGEKIYWVCPKIAISADGDEGVGGASCVERYNSIIKREINATIVHGKLSPQEITSNLEEFRNNNFKVLVCTTVIEVGIDIKDATIMIIENAEMFGISQLHQLRGRVGRGFLPGKCLLLYNAVSPEIKYKIDKFLSLESGFDISNLDLEIRGPGDIIGTAQKGKRSFSFIEKSTDSLLFKIAADIAPSVKQEEFIKKLLNINQEELFIKKN